MSSTRHYILKQIFELELDKGSNAKLISDRISALFDSKVKKLLEKVMNDYEYQGQRVAIDKISIELECDSLDDLEVVLLQQLPHELETALQEKLLDSTETFLKPEKVVFIEHLMFFLEKGFFPWNVKAELSLAELEYNLIEYLNETGISSIEFLIQLLKHPIRFRRFLQQFSFKTHQRVIGTLLPDIHEQWPAKSILPPLSQLVEYHYFWSVLLSEIQQPLPTITSLVTKLKAASKTKKWQLNKKITEYNKKEVITPKEGIFITNAGIVLLNPFIPALFSKLGIVNKKELLLPEKAVQVLNYAVTGNTDFEEWDIPLFKVLCGIPLDELIIVKAPLSQNELIEIESVLKSLIGHWKILKNTHLDSLQEGFLQRHGRLTESNMSWKLRVEQKGIDVLLDHLPWTISYLQFPWMDKALNTEWN